MTESSTGPHCLTFNASSTVCYFTHREKMVNFVAQPLTRDGRRPPLKAGSSIMSFERMSDASIARYYESIREQADADRKHKEHFTASPSVRERADKLRQEMIKRRMQHSPINWPS